MTELRRRKIGKEKHLQKKNHPHTLHLKHVAELNDEIWGTRFSRINLVIGVIVALLIGFMYARYIRDLHENDMWFSNIKVWRRSFLFMSLSTQTQLESLNLFFSKNSFFPGN